MAHHELKTWRPYFEAVASGSKTFEVRKNDRFFQRGDFVTLLETLSENGSQTGASATFRVGDVLQGGQFGIDAGFCVFSLLPIEG